MGASGFWVRFRLPDGRRDMEMVWLSIGRKWFEEIRESLRAPWRAKFGVSTPSPAAAQAWVRSELEKMGIRLNGSEALHLPQALYLRIHVAETGDSGGPKGKWIVLEGLAPARDPLGSTTASIPRLRRLDS